MMILKNKLIQLLILTAFMTVILKLMGRVYWCTCGEYFLWSSEIHSSHNSQHLLDAYSFSHFQHGVLFFFFLSLIKFPSFLAAMFLEACWEILENSSLIIERYRSATFSLNYYGDSIFNSFGDLISCAAGYYLTSKMSPKAALLLYVLIELLMIAYIKDSLTLNVIMLLYPLQSIKNWQAG